MLSWTRLGYVHPHCVRYKRVCESVREIAVTRAGRSRKFAPVRYRQTAPSRVACLNPFSHSANDDDTSRCPRYNDNAISRYGTSFRGRCPRRLNFDFHRKRVAALFSAIPILLRNATFRLAGLSRPVNRWWMSKLHNNRITFCFWTIVYVDIFY